MFKCGSTKIEYLKTSLVLGTISTVQKLNLFARVKTKTRVIAKEV